MKTGQRLRWQEPWFLSVRLRDRAGWKRKGYWIAAIFVVMLIGWYCDQRFGKGPRMSLPVAMALDVFIAVFVGFLNDLGNGDVEMGEHKIAQSFVSYHSRVRSWKYSEIRGWYFIPPKQSGYEFGLLLLMTGSEVVRIGVPRSVKAADIAEMLEMHGVRRLERTEAPENRIGLSLI